MKKLSPSASLQYFHHNSFSNTLISTPHIICPVLEYGSSSIGSGTPHLFQSLTSSPILCSENGCQIMILFFTPPDLAVLPQDSTSLLTMNATQSSTVEFFKVSRHISHTLSPPLKIDARPSRILTQLNFNVSFSRTQISLIHSLPKSISANHFTAHCKIISFNPRH